MALTIKLTLFFCFISFIISCSSEPTMSWWCDQTPHYETCNHYVAGLHPFADTTIPANQFLDMTVQAALDEAHSAIIQIRNMASAAADVPGKTLWGSCVGYFDEVVSTLNMILYPDHDDPDLDLQPTPLDVQTRLSAGLTYITICQKGFELNNMTNPLLPLISKKLTQLIINSLSISSGVTNITRSYVTNEPVDLNISDEYEFADLAVRMPDAVVAHDGSGNFRTIQEAVNSAVNRRQNRRYVIYVKAGVYNEYVYVPGTFKYITMYGDGIGKTIITGNRHCGGENDTSKAWDLQGSATFKVWSHSFIARDITFRNTAGPKGGQALALLVSSDKSAFYRCSFEGYQDTLLTTAYKQFYKECKIYGTVDFIFGGALAVFQDCNIFLRKASRGGLVVTAHGRKSPYEPTGYSFIGCTITAATDLPRYSKVFLGRPWFGLSRTVYMQSFLDHWVDPRGWKSSWKDFWRTAYCGEYMNYGPGSSTDKRVRWPNYHAIKDPKTAARFTVSNFIEGNLWLPQTRVPYTSGFVKRPVLLK